MKFTAWVLRPIVLFAATYTIVTILHELTHALTAYALHIPSTLFLRTRNSRMPSVFIFSRISESLFWIPAAVGTLVSQKQPSTSRRTLELGWADIALLLVAALAVRLMVHGMLSLHKFQQP